MESVLSWFPGEWAWEIQTYLSLDRLIGLLVPSSSRDEGNNQPLVTAAVVVFIFNNHSDLYPVPPYPALNQLLRDDFRGWWQIVSNFYNDREMSVAIVALLVEGGCFLFLLSSPNRVFNRTCPLCVCDRRVMSCPASMLRKKKPTGFTLGHWLMG